jgi:hypothetical protein
MMFPWAVRLRRPQRLQQHQRLKQLQPKQAQLKLQLKSLLKPLLKPRQMRHQKHLLMSRQKPRSKLQLNLRQLRKPLRLLKRWSLCAAMTDLARRKPSPHPLDVLVTNPVRVATMAPPAAVAQMLLDPAVAPMQHGAATPLSRVARAWVTPLSARNAMPSSKPTTPCVVWPCKPTERPWCI